MNYRSDRYTLKVIDIIMKNDVEFDVEIKKGTNRFIKEDYTVTIIFGQGYVDKMAHFNGPSWYYVNKRISSKYGIEDKTSLLFIKSKIQSLFRDHVSR